MVTPVEALQRARALAPELAARARETEAARRIPAASLAALHDAGLMRLLQPRRVGGAELPFAVLVEVTAELAGACASTAWVFANLASHHWMLGMWPRQAQDEVWGEDADTLTGASLIFPAGRACAADGGYRLSGRWSFASGIDACAWVMLGAVLESEDAQHGEYRLFLLPRADYEVIDTWFVAGLAGTGSKEVAVADAFVPAYRSLALNDTQGGATPGSAANPGALYRIPLLPTFGYVVAGVPLGIAAGALALFSGEGRTRLASYSGRNMADFESVQARLAEAAARADAARLILARGCERIMQLAEDAAAPGLLDKARLRRDCAYAARLAVEAVDQLFQASGGSALYTHHPAQRAFRDAHAATAHIALNWDAAASVYGRAVLGHVAELPPYER